MTATAELVTAEELAELHGVTARTVRYWIRGGLPATKSGSPPRWRIDPEVAGPWIARHHGPAMPRVAGLARALEATAGGESEAPEPNGQADELEELTELAIDRRHIARLDRLLDGFTELLFQAEDFDPRLVASVKAISEELRRRESHYLEMRQAERGLIDREDHVRILGTFARLVVDEIQAWSRTTPDAIIDTLTGAGVKLEAKRVAKALDLTLEGQASELRTRITEAVEQAGDIA